MALGAMAIALIAAWYAKRQAVAAEKSNEHAKDQADAAKKANEVAKEQADAATEANRLARESAEKAAKATAFRWEVVPNGGDGKFLIYNSGNEAAHNVQLFTPDFMNGWDAEIETMAPLERYSVVAVIKPDFQSVPGIVPLLSIKWEDRSGETPVQRSFTTTLPDHSA